jgi:topoisomerase-4 subunit A
MRISRYDRDKAEENILALEGKMEQVKHHLANLVTYAIDYFTNIQKNTEKTKNVKPN